MKMPADNVDDAKFAMAPMIDMVFLLLVFFMCTSTISRNEKMQKINLPLADKAVVPKDRPNRWVVNVFPDGVIFSGPRQVNIERLKEEVTARVKEDPKLRIYLRADARTHYREVRKVMTAMAEAGIDDFIFGVLIPGKSDEMQ